MPRPLFDLANIVSRNEAGTQLRPRDWAAAFAEAGFEIVADEAIQLAEDSYLDAFLPRLRAGSSPWRDWPREELAVIGQKLLLRRPG